MRFIKHIYIIPLLVLLACGGNNETPKVNEEAMQYCDSAMILSSTDGITSYEKAIVLLDKATELDTNYYLAYWNKLPLLTELKHYDKALIAAKKLIRANPTNPDIYVTIGTLYERLEDTVSATKYYNNGLELYNKYLDTMTSQTPNYDMLLMNKGITLVMMGKDKEGNNLLKKIYDKQTDKDFKEMLLGFMNKSKVEIMDRYQPK